MRKVNLHFNVSINGIATGIENWGNINNEILGQSNAYYDSVGTVIFGGNTYPGMEQYWPNAAQNSPNALEKELAQKLNAREKIALARHEVTTTWSNARPLAYTDGHSLRSLVGELKAQPGGIISVEGGIKTWQLFFELDLYDEVSFYIQPVLASGDSPFPAGLNLKKITLLETRKLSDGIVFMHYAKGY